MEKTNKPKDTDLIQQRLRAYQPIITLETTVCVLIGLSVLFFAFGFVLYAQAGKSIEKYRSYSKKCTSVNCTLSIDIPENMTYPVYVYYEMQNYFQNHRKYMKSKSYKQLQGQDLDAGKLGECEGALYGKDLYEDYYLNGTAIPDDAVAFPCGIMARTMFNDTFEIYDPSNNRVAINESGIAWESDKDYLFHNYDGDYTSKQWIDQTDEHFIVWMRTALTKNFRKLWGIIEQPKESEENSMETGKYKVKIQNNYNVSSWGGKKLIVLTTIGPLGGNDYMLGMIFLLVGLLCMFISMFFCGRFMISKKGSVTVEQLTWQ